MQRADDLDALDRVDPQIGFKVGIQRQHVLRVAGAVGHQLKQGRCEAVGRWRGGRCGCGGRRGRWRCAGGSGRCHAVQRRDNGAEAARLGKALHGFVDLRGHVGGQRLLQRADDLDALDRVDAQIGFQVGIQRQHVLRVASSVGHQLKQRGFEIDACNGQGRCKVRGDDGNRRRRLRHGRRADLGGCCGCGNDRGRARRQGLRGGHRSHWRRTAQRLLHDPLLQRQKLLHGLLIGQHRFGADQAAGEGRCAGGDRRGRRRSGRGGGGEGLLGLGFGCSVGARRAGGGKGQRRQAAGAPLGFTRRAGAATADHPRMCGNGVGDRGLGQLRHVEQAQFTAVEQAHRIQGHAQGPEF